jgi:hypothetical protein
LERWASSISGPTLTSSSVPRPTFSAPILAASLSANCSATDSWTWKRLADVHASPPLRILASSAPSTAASRSASSKTRNGALPPSSIDTFSTCSADCLISVLPTGVEPVKLILRVRGSSISGCMIEPLDEAVMTLTTPPGRPASSRIWASASIDSGVCLAGLTTHVQPVASAGPILRVPIASGKFHGVMNTHGPIGWRRVSTRPLPVSLIVKRPLIRTASSEYQRKKLLA